MKKSLIYFIVLVVFLPTILSAQINGRLSNHFVAEIDQIQKMPSYLKAGMFPKGTRVIMHVCASRGEEASKIPGYDSRLIKKRKMLAQSMANIYGWVVSRTEEYFGGEGQRGVYFVRNDTYYTFFGAVIAERDARREADRLEKAARIAGDRAEAKIRAEADDGFDVRIKGLEEKVFGKPSLHIRMFVGERSILFKEDRHLNHMEIGLSLTNGNKFEWGGFGSMSASTNSLSNIEIYSFLVGGGLQFRYGWLTAQAGIFYGQKVNNLTDTALYHYNGLSQILTGINIPVSDTISFELCGGVTYTSIDVTEGEYYSFAPVIAARINFGK